MQQEDTPASNDAFSIPFTPSIHKLKCKGAKVAKDTSIVVHMVLVIYNFLVQNSFFNETTLVNNLFCHSIYEALLLR